MGQKRNRKRERREALREAIYLKQAGPYQTPSGKLVIDHQTDMALANLRSRGIVQSPGAAEAFRPVLRSYIGAAIAADRNERGDKEDEVIEWTPFADTAITETLLSQILKSGEFQPERFVTNSLYQVIVFPTPDAAVIKLSIRRLDRRPIRNWRHLQRIKNELVGPECEGFELYPAESRLVDSKNQFFLFVNKQPGVYIEHGFEDRIVSVSGTGDVTQEPFHPTELQPPDAETIEATDARMYHVITTAPKSGMSAK